MRSSDFLFRLIKALSKGDRRNFKLYARLQEGDKAYIRLFDAIDHQAEYDESKLLEQFEGERFTNQFSVAKNYLYNFILKTLHIFGRDHRMELSNYIHQSQILLSKNLFDQAEKLLRKAKHIAERQESFEEMLQIFKTERYLLHRRVQSKLFEATVAQIQVEERGVLEKIANLQQYEHLYDDTYQLVKKSTSVRDPKRRREVELLLTNPILKDKNAALSVRADLKRCDILIDCHRLLNEFDQCLKHSAYMIGLLEKNEDIRREKAIRYINTVCNAGIFHYQIGNLAEAFASLDKLRTIPCTTEQEEIHVFEKYYHFKIAVCTELLDIEEGNRVISEFENEFNTRRGKVSKSTELGIYYLITNFYVVVGLPSEGLHWVNKILNEPRTELRTDIQAMARILNVIIHYELGNRDFLEYNIKSVTRFLSKRDRLFNFERTILKYMRQLTLLSPNESAVAVFQAFGKEVDKVLEDEFERKALNLFDLRSWIDSKLQNRTMAEIALKNRGKVSSADQNK